MRVFFLCAEAIFYWLNTWVRLCELCLESARADWSRRTALRQNYRCRCLSRVYLNFNKNCIAREKTTRAALGIMAHCTFLYSTHILCIIQIHIILCGIRVKTRKLFICMHGLYWMYKTPVDTSIATPCSVSLYRSYALPFLVGSSSVSPFLFSLCTFLYGLNILTA